MKKSELLHKITDIVRSLKDEDGNQIFAVSLKETDAYLFALKEVILDAAHDGDPVILPGLVKFEVVEQPAAKRRNPRTGETFECPAKNKVKVKVLGELKDAV